MEWTRSFDQDSLFIKIDFKKVYDKIEYNFILTMLQVLGFGPFFIQSIQMLFRDAFTILSMNYVQLKTNLACSIHQGCTLAPSLFVLTTEAFGYLLGHKTS